jgi:hypothetical protein
MFETLTVVLAVLKLLGLTPWISWPVVFAPVIFQFTLAIAFLIAKRRKK